MTSVITVVLVVTVVLLAVGMLGLGVLVWRRLRSATSQTDARNELDRLYDTREKLLAAITRTKEELGQLLHDSLKGTSNLKTKLEDYQKLSEAHLRNFADLFTKGTKATGDLGEALAERLLAHVQTISHGANNRYLVISRQQLIPGTQLRPDLTIKGAAGQFPPIYLDIKFPKEVYQHYLRQPAAASKKKLINSLKDDIESINHKYLTLKTPAISPFAIMFVPSDRLFRDCLEMNQGFGRKQDSLKVHDGQSDRSFIDFCFDNCVVPTSPANLIGVLSTLERYFQLFQEIKNQKSTVQQIQR